MKFDFEATSLHGDFKFRVRYEFKDSFANDWTTKLAKRAEAFPDDDLMETYIRKYVEPNIIIDVWKINQEHEPSFSNTQSWVGQYFIAPANWKEEIIARLMQLSTELTETIIYEMLVKTKKAIWDLMKEKETDLVKDEKLKKVFKDLAKDAAEDLNKRIDAMNKKEEERAKERKAEKDLEKEIVSPTWEINQENDLGTINVKLQYFGLAPKEFTKELTSLEMSSIGAFVRVFIKRVVVEVEWKGIGNGGKLTKVFENMHSCHDINDSIFEFVANTTGIPIYTYSSNFGEVLDSFSEWMNEQRRIYMENLYRASYKLEFDPANTDAYCAFKIKKENTPDEMTIVLVANKELPSKSCDLSFKDVLSEIVVFSHINEFASKRYTMIDLKEYRSLFSFLTAEVNNAFNDSRASSVFTPEKLESLTNWITNAANTAKEKKEESPAEGFQLEACYPFKAKFIIEGVRFKFSTQVDIRYVDLKRLGLNEVARALTLDEVARVLTKNKMDWDIDFLDESCNCHVTFNTSVVHKCKSYEEFFEYFKKLMHRSKIEFSNEDLYRRVLLKLVDLFTTFVDKKNRPIIPKERTAQDLLVDEVSKGIQRMKELFDIYVESENEIERLKARWDFASLYNKLIG